MNLVDELHTITAALRGAGLRYAVCGGLAVTIHGVVRTTKDIDLLIAERDIPRALELLRPLGYSLARGTGLEDQGQRDEGSNVSARSRMETTCVSTCSSPRPCSPVCSTM